MNRFALTLVSLMVLSLAPLPSNAEDTKTLNGEFNWTQRDSSGPLEAKFKPTGEGQWDVAFHFDFRGSPHIYSGTATGSLSEGELNGEVKNENEKRTFVFSGSFKDGVYSGTHAETTGDRKQDTGTLTLSN
jgi:hypothetical protein